MEAPDIASTEIGTVHMEDVEVHNGEASPATGDSAVEYIFTAGAPSFAHLKSRYGGRRIPHRSALLASALALAASITVFLVWSALCELPSSKTATDIQLQGNPFARMPEFDAMPTRSWPACEQRETQNTTLLSEAVSINSQNLFGAHLPTVEDCAPVAPSPVAAYLRPVKEELINPLARVDFQTSADVDGTADCRSKRIAEIAKMLSLAADEFEKSSKLVHERLQAASCGQVSAQEQPQRQGSTKRAVVESPVGASVRNPEVVARSSAELIMRAHPSFDLKRPLDGKDAGTMMNLSVSLPSSETEQQQALLQHDYTALKYGNPAASPRPSVPREHSGAARQEASGGRLLSNLQLDSTNAADSKDNEDPKTSVRAVKVERNLDIPHLGTTENMEHQAAAVQETPRREGPSSLVTTFSEAGNKCAETSSPVNGGEHPYVRLPVVPREAIKRNFDYKAALFCRLHESRRIQFNYLAVPLESLG
ncbi:hypothetical protein, conserved [Eimeria praecox]|uniref:Transmembrane protein n=1 Tax=Eimeria praecox TaxID=51316 RepID=U6H3Q8_9EIME|nr:hypothetical protein, conserved [Eimeria praecox]